MVKFWQFVESVGTKSWKSFDFFNLYIEKKWNHNKDEISLLIIINYQEIEIRMIYEYNPLIEI